MYFRTHFLYLLCALTLTAPLYGSHSDLITASSNTAHNASSCSKKTSLAFIAIGLTTTATGYAWYTGTCWAEDILCKHVMQDPCQGNETYKPQAQALLQAGLAITMAGGISLFSDFLGDQDKK